MYSFLPNVQKKYTSSLSLFAKILHENFRLSPNQISVIAFCLSLISAFFILYNYLIVGLVVLFLSLFFDALDGAVARKYKMETAMGRKLEIIFDRTAELILFLSLWLAGYVGFCLVMIALFSIALMTILAFFTKIDFGAKRIMIFFGAFFGFAVAFYLIIFVQAVSIIFSLWKLIY